MEDSSKRSGESADSPPVSGYTWQYVLGLALQYRRELVFANVIALGAVFASIPVPLLMPMLVDEVLLGQPGMVVHAIDRVFPVSWHGPMLYIGATLVVTVTLRTFSTFLGIWQTRQFTRIAKDVSYRLRRQLLLRLGYISLAEYESLGSGAVVSHFVTDIATIDEYISQTVARFLIAVLTLVGVATVLLWLHWPLALFILFMNPLVIYFTILIGKRVKELKRRENRAFELFQDTLTETLEAIQQIRASNRERHYLGRVIARSRKVRDHTIAHTWMTDAANRLSFVVFLIGVEGFRAVSMLLVVFSDLTIGEMTAVFGYLWFMMSHVQEVLNIQYAHYGAMASITRLNRLLDLRQEPKYPHLANPFKEKHTVSVRVEEMCFSYGDGPAVLDRLSMKIREGEKVAIVGASGGGKSTLIQVLLGLYPPVSGNVYFDEVPVTDIGMEVVREHVAVVLQHPALFNDSVRMNLTLGRDLPVEFLWRALGIAQLKEHVESLPRGVDTLIGRQGVRLSGGQRQRLAIARMVLSNPKVVILDEATSALDTETEARLHEALHGFLQHRTTLIVAHRLSAVKQADRVYVFDAGRIIQEGEHAELIGSGGLYSKLYGHFQTV